MKRCDFFAFRIGKRFTRFLESLLLEIVVSDKSGEKGGIAADGLGHGNGCISTRDPEEGVAIRDSYSLANFELRRNFFFLGTWDEFNKMPRLKKELRKQYDNPSRVWNLSTEGNVIFTICPSNETNEGRNI